MRVEVINKITVTPEAVFDYEESLELGKLNKRPIKAEVEEYIDRMNRAGRLLQERYFHCKYLDADSGRMLMLFFYRAENLSVMQYWNLQGVCFAEDWSEDAEAEGGIRNWLKERITDLGNGDWVLEQQVRAEADKIICGYTVQGSIQGLPEELKYAIEYGNNQEFTEALSVLQNAGGKRAWREVFARKTEVSRKLNQRPV